MNYTLLDLTQLILSSLDSDEVNSINDTVESRQVANLVRTAYYNIITRSNLPEHYELFNLDATTDPTQPTLMYRPDNVLKIDWIKYDISDPVVAGEPEYEYVTILPLRQFLDMVHKFDLDDADVDGMTINGHEFYFRSDKEPKFCTILSDNLIIFDAYNSDVDATLQSSKTLVYGKISPTFSLTDTFTPDLDDIQFALLLNEAKSLAFLELKQVAHEGAIMEARKQWKSLQHNKYLNDEHPFNKFANFGRRTPRTINVKL